MCGCAAAMVGSGSVADGNTTIFEGSNEVRSELPPVNLTKSRSGKIEQYRDRLRRTHF
jgi:hypothetical protein